MITLITGAPGAGKSAACVELLSELSKDRAVYVSGIPDLKINHIELVDPTQWINDVPDGSIIVIDEVQRIWRPRGPGSKVPPDIAALETHRHRGLDFYVITQAPRLMDGNIRGLVGRHVHLRDLGLLGRWWYEWPECAESCNTSWRQAPIKKRFRLSKAALALYTSASMHIKPVRSVPWMMVVLVLAVILCCFVAWKSYTIIQARMHPAAAEAIVAAQQKASAPGSSSFGASGGGARVSAPYDSTIFTPRVSNRPESAPAYDDLRQVVAMPVVVGGVCFNGKCKCLTQQGTPVIMSDAECKMRMENPEFDPYQVASGGSDRTDKMSARGGRSSPPSDVHASVSSVPPLDHVPARPVPIHLAAALP